MHIQFIIPYLGEITQVEVKSSIHTRSKSFDNFIRNHESRYAFRFSKKNVGISDDGVTRYLPLYTAVWALEGEKIVDSDCKSSQINK